MHRELGERLLLNQQRPYTTIPEAMSLVDTELSKIEDSGEKKEDDIKILNEYNKYLIFLEKYFSDSGAKPLKLNSQLIKEIFN